MSGGNPYWNPNSREYRDAGMALILKHSWGAIAYSPATGRYGWSYGKGDQTTAEQSALSYCGENDAKILCWGQNTTLALALSDEGYYSSAWGGNPEDVKRRALQACNGTNCRIVLLYHTRTGKDFNTQRGGIERPINLPRWSWLPKVILVLFILFILFVVVLTILYMNGIYVLPRTHP